MNFILPSISSATIIVTIKDALVGCISNSSVFVTLQEQQGQNDASTQQEATTNYASTAISQGTTASLNILADQIALTDQLLLGCTTSTSTPTCNSASDASYSCQPSSTACSGHGTCAILSISPMRYQCHCSQGYFMSDCNMNQTTYDQQLKYRQDLIDLVTRSILSTPTTSTVDLQHFSDLLNLLETLTKDPFLNNNQTLSTTLITLEYTLGILNNQQLTNDNNTNLTEVTQQVADILSNVLNQINQTDCSMATSFASQTINSTYSILGQLADLSLKNASAGQNTTITTDSFLMYGTVVNSNQLQNLSAAPSDSTPQVTLGTVNNPQNLPSTVLISYTYLKRDMTSCSSVPPTNFTLEIKDATTFQPLTVSVPVTVTYPSSIFKSISCPSSSCAPDTDSSGNIVCSCSDISIFDVKNQLINIYQNSQLKQITLQNLAALFTNPPFKRWSFWVAIGYSLALVITWIVVKTVNKEYCIVLKLRRAILAARRNKQPIHYSWCYKFYIGYIIVHPILNIFVFKDPTIGKGFRALLCYLRVMILLGMSAIFAPVDQTVIFNFKCFDTS